MKTRNTILFNLVCGFLVSIVICIFCLHGASYKQYIVPGTVFSKTTEQYAHGKHNRNMSTRYIMCVKPNDTNKFKHYALYVDYATYCTHNVGDKITFSLSEKKCLRDFKSSIWIEHISGIVFILFGMLSVFLFAGIIITSSSAVNLDSLNEYVDTKALPKNPTS